MLKQEGYSRFYENIVKIISCLTKKNPLIFTEQQKNELISRFYEIQPAYDKVKAARKNFPSYSYIMFKLCELLGYDEFLKYLPLLAPENLLRVDSIWKKICQLCKYQYIPTDPDYTVLNYSETFVADTADDAPDL